MKSKLFLLFFGVVSNLFYAQTDYTKLVNTFVGTAEHGHTFPGATLPFGMMQLSPDTGVEGWDWCSGYHSSDSSLMGFSHTHLSGTGVGDYGDILFMPTVGEIKFEPGSKSTPDEGYRSRFKHKNETAQPGYYSVYLDDYNTNVELTTTLRAGLHKYKFNNNKSGNVIIDLAHGIQDAPIEAYLNIIDNNKVEGYRTSSGWANRHTVYFYAEFSQNISNYLIEKNKKVIDEKSAKNQFVKAALSFEFEKNNELLVKIGISHVSMEGAKLNLESEIPDWNFEKVKKSASEKWSKYLSKIEVEGGTQNQQSTYYTALYHAFIAPNIFNDVDKKYMGMDRKVRTADDFNMYTIFSLWDTFRALHPLLTIVDEDLTNDLIKSLLAKYEEGGLLPVWELAANETFTMIGYHSIPVIFDAYKKGIRDYDIDLAFKAMKNSSMQDERGLKYYKSMGFIPMDKSHDAVSSTLEYAYDDWCIAQMAKDLGNLDDYDYYMSRAKNYINMYNPETTFMQGRYNSGEWSENFDPISPSYLGSGEFTEGNSWQYSWFVPQDIDGLINLFGGEKSFTEKLDSLFTINADPVKYKMPSDVTGLIGQYAQGNEPSHHISYLYNYSGYPWKSQNILREIMDGFFTDQRDGLCGNEDCGQMSAWYALSAIGFYPVAPGSNEYVLGSPLFDKIIIHQENGKDFTIVANNNSHSNKYIQNISLNGNEHSKLYFTHDEMRTGSTIKLNMVNEPNKNLGVDKTSRPNSSIDKKFKAIKYDKYFMPIVEPHKTLFANSVEVTLSNYNDNTEIRFTTDGTEPTIESEKYTKPFKMEKTFTLKASVFGDDLKSSDVIEKIFKKSIVHDENDPFYLNNNLVYPLITKEGKYHKNYTGSGKNALIDGNFGNTDFRNPYWQGYEKNDCEVVIDLGKKINVNKISVNFLENQGSWIFLPTEVTVAFSDDGKEFSQPVTIMNEEITENYESAIKTFDQSISKSTRYIKFYADNIGECPSYHKGAGAPAFMFIDEIVIE